MDLIIDACGWTAAVDASVNLDHALLPLVGRPTWLVPEGVRDELGALDLQRRGLLLALLDQRATVVQAPEEGLHPDDHIVDLAKQHRAATLTVDRGLKGRLIQAGCPVIEVVDRHRLRRIDP